MAEFLKNGDFLANEWAHVICVGLAFFVMQIVLCISFCFGIRRQERAIKRLHRDFEQGGDGRNHADSLGRKHAWLHWVLFNFPADSTAPSNFTREDVLQELDTRIASNGNYLLLQRMGVMAPLLGVILTVAGFYWLRVGDENQSLQTILLAVTPLVSGVGTGAVLALINQGLLHIAGRRVESLRMTARSWFDIVIWCRLRSGALPANLTAAQVMDHFVRSALDEMNRLSDTLAHAAEISAAMSALPVQLHRILDRKIPAAHKAPTAGQSGRVVSPQPTDSGNRAGIQHSELAVHLEKVTSHSGQAALAGWISSNDVTLFTTVLVMAIAMFLHTRMTKETANNVQIIQEKAALTSRLEATAGELQSSNEFLDKTRKSLNFSQEERDQLRQQLVEKLAAVAALNTRLDALLKDKGQLELQQQSLTSAKDSLSKEKTSLVAQQVTLAGERDSLKDVNSTLREKLDLIASQLAVKVAALEQLEKDRDSLKKQTNEMDAIIAGLKQRLDKLNINLADAQAESQTKAREMKAQLAQSDKTADEYLAKLKRTTELLDGVKVEKHELEDRFTRVALEHQAALLEENRNSRELIGLAGRLERVAILFDASGSMRQATTKGTGDRWSEVQQIAATWLQHLSVQQCVLIVFSSDVQTFPEDGSLADLRGDGGKAKRDLLLRHLKAVSPDGLTNTYAALQKAYQYDVDSILLFSDGAPSLLSSGAFEPAAAKKIYELCRTHPSIPINTVGLGNYFDKNASTFLMSLAKISNGTFRGQ